MKMTMHIDEKLLKAAMKATGAETKTAAVAEALRRVTLKARQKELWSRGLGTPEEIAAGFDADLALGLKPSEPALVAERKEVRYERPKRSR